MANPTKRALLAIPTLLLLAGCSVAPQTAVQNFDFDVPVAPIGPGLPDVFTPHDLDVSYEWKSEVPLVTATWSSAIVPLSGAWTIVYDYGYGDAEVVYCAGSPCAFGLWGFPGLPEGVRDSYLDDGAALTVAAGNPDNPSTIQATVGVPSVVVLSAAPEDVTLAIDWEATGTTAPPVTVDWTGPNSDVLTRPLSVHIDWLAPFDTPNDGSKACYAPCQFPLRSIDHTRYDPNALDDVRIWLTDATGETYEYDRPLPLPPAESAPAPPAQAPGVEPVPAEPVPAEPVPAEPDPSVTPEPGPTASAPSPGPTQAAGPPAVEGTTAPPEGGDDVTVRVVLLVGAMILLVAL